MKINNFIFKHRLLYKFCTFIKKLFSPKVKCKIVNSGKARLIKDIQGKNNTVIISTGCVLNDTTIRIHGNNNTLTFGENCCVGSDCSFWLEGNNINITIGDNTTFTRLCHLNAQEDGTSIIVGKDCMFSNNIIVRTSDSHPIYDLTSGKRTNKAENVIIGNHVWIAPNSKIMKGG